MGLFVDSSDRIFGTFFGLSWTVLRFGFDPRIDVFEFYGVFWYPNNSVTNHEGTKVPCFMWVRDLGHFMCYCCKILNNMLLCVKIMLIYTICCINMDCMDANYM